MGDAPVTAPATPAAQPQSAPTPANEVAIDVNPVRLPNPMSSTPGSDQTPPEGSQHKPQSRREAIQAAFERASRPQQAPPKTAPRAAPGPAEAKPGHNKPPEPTEAEPPKLNLKRRPDDQAPVPAVGQPRGERGRFVPIPRTEAPDSTPAPAAASEGSDGQPVRPPSASPYATPPARMADHAKREWGHTPESVRGEVHRMQTEFVKAYNVFKNDFEAFKPVKRFHQLAQQHGTTLEKALTNYVGMEQKLRSDVVGGLDTIVTNLQLKTADGQPITLRDIAYHVLSQTPDQLRAVQMGNQQQAAAHQIGALHQELAGLRQAVHQMNYAQQYTATRAGVDQYAADKPRLDELAPVIVQEINAGYDLDTAYRRAELLHPTTQAAQTRTPSAQTRNQTSDRSISGSPSSGGTVVALNGNNGKPLGRREAIAQAMRRTGSGF